MFQDADSRLQSCNSLKQKQKNKNYLKVFKKIDYVYVYVDETSRSKLL